MEAGQEEGAGGEGLQVGLLEGQGTAKGTLTPPEPVPGSTLEGEGTTNGTLTPQGVGRGVKEEKEQSDPKNEMRILMEKQKAKEMASQKQEGKKTPMRKRRRWTHWSRTR